jgi:hypothetical protein
MRLIRLVAPFLLLAACKQGVGARCQIDSDCESGLVCSTAEPKTCRENRTEVIDAAVLADARVVDAAAGGADAGVADAKAPDAAAPAPDAQ